MVAKTTLLGHLAPWIGEDIATEGLAYILNKSSASRKALDDLLAEGGISVSPITKVETQKTLPDKGRIDLVGFGSDQSTPLIVEVKFGASLTANQPNSYLDWFTDENISILLFLVPESRIKELWGELKLRIEEKNGGLTEVESERRCMRVGKTKRHIMLVSWKSMLSHMAIFSRAEGEDSTIEAEIQQLIGLASSKNTESTDRSVHLYSVMTANNPAHQELDLLALTGDVIERCNSKGILERRNLRQGKGQEYFARYFYISNLTIESCLIVRSERWKNEGVALSFEITNTGRKRLDSLGFRAPTKFADWVGINLEQSAGYELTISNIMDQLREIAAEMNALVDSA